MLRMPVQIMVIASSKISAPRLHHCSWLQWRRARHDVSSEDGDPPFLGSLNVGVPDLVFFLPRRSRNQESPPVWVVGGIVGRWRTYRASSRKDRRRPLLLRPVGAPGDTAERRVSPGGGHRSRSPDIRLFDYAKQFALPFREAIRAHTEQLADEEGVEIEYIQRMKAFRKEDRIQQILAVRGTRPGLVHIFSAMEPCPTYEPWHDKKTGCTFIRRDRGKCLHYYFYFIDEMLGLCFLSVPTWCPST